MMLQSQQPPRNVMLPFLTLAWILLLSHSGLAQEEPVQPCHAWTGSTCEWEPNLRPMTVQYSSFNETFYAYQIPDVSTFYNLSEGSRQPKEPKFTGLFGKFINMSPTTIQVYWKPSSFSTKQTYIADIEPFGSAGTATYPGHHFVVVDKKDSSKILTKFTIQKDNSLYYYDPYDSQPTAAKKALSQSEYHLYHLQLQNRAFAHQYRQFTGYDWLALYKEKLPPRLHMWRADSFGQTHVIETNEIHFVELPSEEELKRGTSVYGPRPDELKRMRLHRHQQPTLNLTLTALSCAPRVFEIRNFLSQTEVHHLLTLVNATHMTRSSTKAGAAAEERSDDNTRTSRNSWIARNQDLIVDIIHRRAADVLGMDEKLLRWRRASELPEFPESHISLAEQLQLVHYSKGEQYTPHHDFSMPGLIKGQPSRFATLLFYLNDNMQGGETSFPRWLNAETSEALNVKPEVGKAILFYNLLPDGNYDERSQHAALPILDGEKYVMNLWVWDPVLWKADLNTMLGR